MATQIIWTAKRAKPPQYFHMLANGYALFTQTEKDAFKCLHRTDAEQLCAALEETDPSGWEPVLLSEKDGVYTEINIDSTYTYTSELSRPFCPCCGANVDADHHIKDPTVAWVGTCINGHTHIHQLEIDDD